MSEHTVTKRYFYHGGADTPKHKNKVSAFMVEELTGDNIVARITPMGLYNVNSAQPMLTIEAMKQGLSLVGDWREKGKHVRRQVVEG